MVGKKPEPKRDWSKERVAEVVLYHLQQALRAHGMYEHASKDYIFLSIRHLVCQLIDHHENIIYPEARIVPTPAEKRRQ